MRAGGIDEASAHHAAGRHRRRGIDHARMELQVPRGRGRAGVPDLLQPSSRGQRSVSPRGRGRPPPGMGTARRLSVRQGRGEMMTRHASGSPQRTFMKTTIGMKTTMSMKTTMGLVGTLLLASASSAGADDAEHLAMARVRLTTEPSVASGCTRVGQVSDDSVKDLRRKIVRAGGDVGVLSFSTENMEIVLAQVYRCPAPASAAPRTAPPTAAPAPPPPPPPN